MRNAEFRWVCELVSSVASPYRYLMAQHRDRIMWTPNDELHLAIRFTDAGKVAYEQRFASWPFGQVRFTMVA